MSTNSFGLDIGSTSIKIVSLKKETNTLSLESVAASASTARGLLSESFADQKSLADNIRLLVESAQIKTVDVNISIPESQVYTKIIDVPSLSEQELTAALKWELEQYIPLPISQAKVDWQILERREKNGKKTMSVLLVAAPLILLERYENILSLAGLNARAIETEILSVQRSLYPLVNTTSSSMIVHIGASTTDVAVIKNGTINMVFFINVGGIAITRSVSLDLGIDIVQAEDLKKAYGLNKEVFEGKIGKSLHPTLEGIAQDIKKAILLYKEKNENEEIHQIILSGGSALLPGIDTFFANILNVQVVLGSCWTIYNIQNVPEEIRLDAPSYNIVVGLALRGLL